MSGTDYSSIDQFPSETLESPTSTHAKSQAKTKNEVQISKIPLLRHAVAFMIFYTLGPLPTLALFKFMTRPFHISDQACLDSGAFHQSPIQVLITPNRTFGTFPYWAAKLIDTAWDLVIGRGLQAVALAVAYVVFTSALVRSIETAPISIRSYFNIALESSTISSIWGLGADLRRQIRKRTVLLLIYIIASSCYILAMPTLFSTMTGYVNKLTWMVNVNTTDSGAEAVTHASLSLGIVASDASRINLTDQDCLPTEGLMGYLVNLSARVSDCNCTQKRVQSPNCNNIYRYQLARLGNKTYYNDYWFSTNEYQMIASCAEDIKSEIYPLSLTECINKCPDSDSCIDPYANTSMNCRSNFNITLYGVEYDLGKTPLHMSSCTGACLNGTSSTCLSSDYIADNSFCMNSNDNIYQWGFSGRLTTIVVICQLLWASSMYAVWLYAEFTSRLLHHGYSTNQLRATLALSAAVQDTLDLRIEEVRTLPSCRLEARLREKSAVVRYDILHKEIPVTEFGE